MELIMKKEKFFNLMATGLMNITRLLAFLVIIFSFQISSAAISTDSYCQLSIQSLQKQVANFQELIALANQYSNDPETFAQLEATKQAEFEATINTLLASYGMTAEEYALYMGQHKKEVEEYLAANPDIQQQLDDLHNQATVLMEEYEALTKEEEKQVIEDPPLM